MDQRTADINKHFLNIQLTDEMIDVYMPRISILEAMKSSLQVFNGKLLDVGCGKMPYRELIRDNNPKVTEYIGLDLAVSDNHDTSVADLLWDGKTIPLEDNSVDSVMATEVLEHSFKPDETLAEIFRVLKPGGTFFFTVPFIWPLHETPYDAFRYTPFSLKMFLENAGFSEPEIKSLGGWHAAFAQMMGLWVKESPLTGFRKKWALRIAKKLFPYLIKNDVKDNGFGQHCMITGLYGTAIKK